MGCFHRLLFGLILYLPFLPCKQGCNLSLYFSIVSCLPVWRLGGILLVNGQSFRIKRQDIPSLFLLALLYLMSAVFLFWGYKFMASGVATTIHFMYPVLTTLIMMLFFKEKKSGWRIAAIASAVAGVYFLSGGDTKTGKLFFPGTFHCSSVGTRICALSRHNEPTKNWTDEGATAYFLRIPFRRYSPFIGTETISQLQPISEWHTAGNLILLALIPTVVSNLALVRAVKSIGSTLTSVLGAMEPVTAVCVGIFLFGEAFTTSIGIGIALIIAAVIVIILKR